MEVVSNDPTPEKFTVSKPPEPVEEGRNASKERDV
jgi:hypothetical protein